ncbi:hypothetical protein D3C73_438070 [compost metagenome]
MTIQASTQLREDFGNGGGRSGTGWDQAHAGGTRTAKILVWLVENALGVCQVMDGGDRAVANAQLFVDDFHHWRQTVGGARSSRDDAMFRRIEQLMIDAHDDVQRAFFLHWSADHHTLNALIQVGLQHRHGFHLAAGLDHQIATRPVGVGNRFVRAYLDALAANHHLIAFSAGFIVPTAMHRVEVDQVRMSHRVTCWIVDLYEFKLWPAPGCSQSEATDPAKTIDANFDSHVVVLCICCQWEFDWVSNWPMYSIWAGC